MNMLFRQRFLAAISLARKAIDDRNLQCVDEGRALRLMKFAEPAEEFI